jgi:hypothetical protein
MNDSRRCFSVHVSQTSTDLKDTCVVSHERLIEEAYEEGLGTKLYTHLTFELLKTIMQTRIDLKERMRK